MKRLIFLIIVVFIVVQGTHSFAQTKKLYGKEAYIMKIMLERYHYHPINLNDEISEQIYLHFLKELDPYGIYFTQKEIADLSEWKNKLDDEIENQSTVFIEKAAAIYRERLVAVDTLIGEILSKPMNFSAPDTLRFYKGDPKLIKYRKDEVALKKYWNKWLKYEVLSVMFSSEDDTSDLFSTDIKKIIEKEPDARKKVLKRNKRSMKRMLNEPQGFENHVASVFLNSFTNCYDPHTEFFSPTEKQEFQESLSTDEYALGIYFDENDKGEVKISSLEPGGAAWKTNQLHEGDILLSVKVAKSPAVDLSSSTAEEVDGILNAIIEKEVDLTVRTSSGQVKRVNIIKTKIRSDENVVKSFILDGEKKIGYISLPSFYTDWDNNSRMGCANDIAKEIVKLQEEKIDGLVLDLRYNGGGSVGEAISLAGIFIDEGPLCIHKSRDEKPRLLKDINRGTAYSGPLLVMVNGLSASASELFSAAMQDYNRAIITGSTTYGKATGQIVIPIDTSYSREQIMSGLASAKDCKLGFVKVTTDKYYRVTNSTCQKQGLAPDIFLPYPYIYDDYRESKCETALAIDSVIKKVIYAPLPTLPRQEISIKSKKRLDQNLNFKRLNFLNDSLLLIENLETPIPLNPNQFRKAERTRYRLLEAMDDVMDDSTRALKVVTNKYDKKVDDMDHDSKEINEVLMKNIGRDIYIQESYHVIVDLINFENK